MGSQTQQKINEDLRSALKSGDQITLGVLRMVSSVFGNKSIEKRGRGLPKDLTEDEVLEILNREAKKRREAASLYKQGNRSDLAEKEEKEIVVIQKYLPAQMSRKEVETFVTNTLPKLRSSQDLNFGSVMKEIMKELKDKADAKIISEIIKEKLA